MATIYPTHPPERSPNSELKVRDALKPLENLIVLHSVVWQALRNGKQSDGEADFILLHPQHGIAIMEVKGGGIEVINGKWLSTGADGVGHPIKNPFEQAKDSKYALLGYLKAINADLARIPIVHGVIFPDIEVNASLGFAGPRDIVIDRRDLTALPGSLTRLFQHWGKTYRLSQAEIDQLVSSLAPTTRIRRKLADEVSDAEQQLIELTREQVGILQSLKRVRRAAIIGGAGTGKTILAMEKARQLAEAGFQTLLICYNEPLKSHIARSLAGTEVHVQTFHSLVVRECRLANLKIPYAPSEAWYEEESNTLLRAAADLNGTKYDAILIDEAQDFAGEWVTSLQNLLTNQHSLLYVFADSHQDLYRRKWQFPSGLFEFELTVNCRNTRPIAAKVAQIFGDTLSGGLAEGPIPNFLEATRQDQVVAYAARLVERLLLDEQLKPSQIAVLTDSTAIVSSLRSMIVAGHLFTTLDGQGIPVDTIYRFKGLERDVVILAFTDKAVSKELDALAYVGLSRAKSALYVVGSPAVRSAISWDIS